MQTQELEANARAQRAFFNGLAPQWRRNALAKETVARLLEPLQLQAGSRVLDVACGAGVLDGQLLSMGLAVDALDIAEKMIERARSDRALRAVNFMVADFYDYCAAAPYDALLVFDAYPHFPDKALFAARAHALLREGGALWIFFDQGRDSVNARHREGGSAVSVGLRSAREEAAALEGLFRTVYLHDSAEGYYIGLIKKEK